MSQQQRIKMMCRKSKIPEKLQQLSIQYLNNIHSIYKRSFLERNVPFCIKQLPVISLILAFIQMDCDDYLDWVKLQSLASRLKIKIDEIKKSLLYFINTNYPKKSITVEYVLYKRFSLTTQQQAQALQNLQLLRAREILDGERVETVAASLVYSLFNHSKFE